MKHISRNSRRLDALRRKGGANAIEYVEVSDASSATLALRQRTLVLQLLAPLNGLASLRPSDVSIMGGDRFPAVRVEWVARGDALPAGVSAVPLAEFEDPARTVVVRTSGDDPSGGRGDHSEYTLRFVDPARWQLDPQLAFIQFRFKVECPSPFDCAGDCSCNSDGVGEPPATPVIDYLVKDYSSFRRVLLDRMSLLMPGWTERHAADVGMMLAELVAYAADRLSYQQDAIASEGLFPIARDRVSLRRHSRLLDYHPDEGDNARVYVRFSVDAGTAPIELPAGLPLYTGAPGAPVLVLDASTQTHVLAEPDTVVFETMQPAVISGALDMFEFWSYGEMEPILAQGATSAALKGHHPELRVGDDLLLGAMRDPLGAEHDDTDPRRSQIVRLTGVTSTVDAVGSLFNDSGPDSPAAPVEITEIQWHLEDALHRPLCLTTNGGSSTAARAFGNLALADHGRTVKSRPLPDVPPVALEWPDACDGDESGIPPRYRPVVPTTSLIHAMPLSTTMLVDGAGQTALTTALRQGDAAAARSWLERRGIFFGQAALEIRGREGAWSVGDGGHAVLVDQISGRLRVSKSPLSIAAVLRAAGGDSGQAVPAVAVSTGNREWLPIADLLSSGPDARRFVAEIDSAGRARLRFGDGRHGLPLAPGSTPVTVSFREGGGSLGHIGAGAIRTIDISALSGLPSAVFANGLIQAVSNPLPSQGGSAAETDDVIRRTAPYAFREQRRAVTMADYGARAGTTPGPRGPAVQRAEATSRWTGSWYTTYLAIDPVEESRRESTLPARIAEHVDSYRMAGVDLDVDKAVYVPLEIELDITVDDLALAVDVEREVLDVLGVGSYFHADRFTFGQDVLLSPLVAAAAAVDRVRSVTVRRFGRAREDTTSPIANGVIPIARLEIAQCENDRNFPDRGQLAVNMRGGR